MNVSGESTNELLQLIPVLGAFTNKSYKKAPVSFAMSLHFFVCNNSRTARQIFMKFDVG
jgi:hypothetical protein